MTTDDFYYNGHKLSDFNLIMAAPDNEDASGLTRDLLKGNSNPHRTEINHYGAQYSDTLILNLRIIKMVEDDYSPYFSYLETRTIQSWITSTKVPQPLYFDFEFGETMVYLGVFTDIQPYTASGIIGFDLTFTCSSPFAYKEYGTIIEQEDSEISKCVFCDTDEQDFVYPKVIFSNIGDGDFSIINTSDENREMKVSLSSGFSEYVFDCRLKRILADDTVLTLADVGWSVENITDYNNVNTGIYKAYWLRLLPGINNLIISGSADCKIEFLAPVKIGGYADVWI